MKTRIVLSIAAISLLLGASRLTAQSALSMGYGGSAGGEAHQTLVLKPDGSCLLTYDRTTSRKSLEMAVRNWERYRNRGDDVEPDAPEGLPDGGPPPVQPSREQQKPLTDDELAGSIHKMYEQRFDSDEESPYKVDKVEIQTNSVRTVFSRSFDSVEALLADGVYAWGPSALGIANARLEIDTNHQFRITFIPAARAASNLKNLSREWKMEKVKSEWKFVAPGKVLSSDFPQTDGNATGFKLDGEKPESIEAALKLVGTNLVVVAEANGLRLDKPLDAMTVMRSSRRNSPNSGPDLPITEASPGFIAQATGLTISTVYLFPEGEKQKQEPSSGYYPGSSSPGVLVMAKLFPPQGRELRSVSLVEIKSAKDDKGRAIAPPASDEPGVNIEDYANFYSDSPSSERGGPASIQLHLALPAPDAQSIEEVNAETIALTIGSWKEMTLTNVHADTNVVIALDDVLPGAKLVVRKVTYSSSSTSVEARLEGPAAVRRLEIKFRPSTQSGGNSSNLSERRTSTAGDKTIRNITVQNYDYESSARGRKDPVTLIVRSPQDLKRERVHFKLTGLDLL